MNREIIKDIRGRIVAYIEISARGDKIVRDASGRYLGRYDALSKMTIDPNGKFLYQGDQASLLIPR